MPGAGSLPHSRARARASALRSHAVRRDVGLHLFFTGMPALQESSGGGKGKRNTNLRFLHVHVGPSVGRLAGSQLSSWTGQMTYGSRWTDRSARESSQPRAVRRPWILSSASSHWVRRWGTPLLPPGPGSAVTLAASTWAARHGT